MRDAAPVARHRLRPSPVAWGSVVAPHTPEPDPIHPGDHRELDGQCGVAVVAVVVFHVYQFCNVDHFLYYGTPAYRLLNCLDAAVPWLFVVIGFLAFEPIARAAIDGRPRISARRFVSRRAVRLLPVYYIAVVVTWFLRQRSLPGDWRDLLEHLSFSQVFDAKRIFYTIGPAWAVSVVVCFYLALLIISAGLARICAHLARRRQRIVVLAGASTALAAISWGWKAWSFGVAQRPPEGSFTTWFGPVASLDNFAAGMAVAVLVAALRQHRPLGLRGQFVLAACGLVPLVAAFGLRQPGTWSTVYFSAVCSIGFGCFVAAAVLGGPRAGQRVRTPISGVLPWLGTISLSVYLWHEPLMLVLRSWGLVRQSPDAFVRDTVVVVLASIVIGWLSHTAFERPAVRLAEVFRTQPGPGRRQVAEPGA